MSDMNLKEKTLSLIKKYSITPKKELGQSFLINEQIAKRIVEWSNIDNLKVLEIGPGLGALTELLALRAKIVYAIEIDPILVKILREEVLRNFSNIVLIEADFLEIAPPSVDVVVSNIPYSIATPILFKLARECIFERAILTLQKELALRIISKPGSRDYGRLTASLSVFFKPTLLSIVKRENFYPEPDVDSAVIKLERYKPPFEIKDLDLYLEVVRALFTQRNKLLRKALRLALDKLLDIKIDKAAYNDERLKKYMSLRVKNLAPIDLAEISNVLKEYIVK